MTNSYRRLILLASLFPRWLGSFTPPPSHHAAVGLHTMYLSMLDELNQSQFLQPLVIRSDETSSQIHGDVYATMKFPFQQVAKHLNAPQSWCDLLILHINNKRCVVQSAGGETQLLVHVGSKKPEPLTSSTAIAFTYSALLSAQDYFAIQLKADDGPFGTSDYRLMFETIPLSGTHCFVHVAYSYRYGLMGRLAMQTYLKTIGRNKVGFSQTGTQNGTQPAFIAGMRGALERNIMRYYLALLAYMNSVNAAPEDQVERRLAYWFDAVEQYPLQLHENSGDDYLLMKRGEIERQTTR